MSAVPVAEPHVKPGERYRHYKGGVYEVICEAVLESDGSKMVVYHPLDKGDKNQAWCRPMSVFFEKVLVNNHPVQRFTKVDSDS
ncbi:DUF1653 domain-containing protein [Limnobacter humi]|uniref:DUF1653 domain-containing protein n=1 Tax=Limnobacter humi TaxID=1778671 RepID=A0ABT1WHP4_9BURK|nr:DUF1653 domain-containing protein [Limnobacter humi]MCQ8897020.1 DUF1653 domain-containing protein [Limnobacter humi]